MSVWDTEIFGNDSVIELFDEVQDLDSLDRVGALIDAGRIGLDSENSDETACALAAAVIIAIWNGAPFSGGDIVEDYGFIREGISETHGREEDALAIASEVFDSLLGGLSESDQAALEDFVEAVE
ncbi:DUF4259 domain-containing protein [uncultured Corynebacterium sp.]|uniref:DUF4259 domain-containing protein n=1 Tax=uncultured Corynebacterium sp. TaxID=159447 RepID=UPI002635F3A8|nr:DUF4259 domain-containing protein [uncultured Corynebacterium sp.]